MIQLFYKIVVTKDNKKRKNNVMFQNLKLHSTHEEATKRLEELKQSCPWLEMKIIVIEQLCRYSKARYNAYNMKG